MILVLYGSYVTNQQFLLSCNTSFSVVLPVEVLPQCGSPENRLVLPRWGVGPPSSASGATFHVELYMDLDTVPSHPLGFQYLA